MFQFTSTTVINSVNAKDYNGVDLLDGTGSVIPVVKGSATQLDIAKVGSFKKANITGLYKRPYTAGVLEQATVVVPQTAAGKVLKLTVTINLSGATSSDYVSSTVEFDKNVIVEIVATNNATNDAASIVAQLNSFKNRFGLSYLSATNSGATITLKAKDFSQRFASIKLVETAVAANGLDIAETALATGTVTVAGKTGFGDDTWMIQSVVLPTSANTNFFGTLKNERPELSGNYTQYTIHYSIDNPADLKGVFAGAKSNTTHVLWVKNSLVSGVETELNKLGISYGEDITGTTTVVVGATSQLAFAGVGAITWSAEAGKTGVATLSAAGVVTGVGAGTIKITAADAVGNTAEVTVTVTAS